jgi:hypothetical protein
LSISPLAKINIPPSPFKGGDAMVSIGDMGKKVKNQNYFVSLQQKVAD